MQIENKDLHNFQDMIISALRYALGRRTYITGETADFIKKYSYMIDKRVKKIMLKDLDEYFDCRDIYYKDDENQELMGIRCVTPFEELRINIRYKDRTGKTKEYYTSISTYKSKDNLVEFISQEDANEMIRVLHKIIEEKKNK